jgi:signal peptidase II
MLVSLVLLAAVDLGTKEWALRNLSAPRPPEERSAVCEPDGRGHIAYQRQPDGPRPLIEGVLNLQYAENCGAAFSMLRTAPEWLRVVVFGTVSAGAAFLLISMFVRGAGGPLFALAVPLILSGAAGNNLGDRPRHGFVVDFLQVDPDLFSYPIFNVADIWIVAGAILMLLDGFLKRRKAPVDPPPVLPPSARTTPQ